MIQKRQILIFTFSLVISLSFIVPIAQTQAEEALSRKKEVEALYREAMSLYFTFSVVSQNEKDVLEAKEIFEKILKTDPTQEKARLYLDEKIPARLEKLRRIREEEKQRRAEQKILDEEKSRKREKLEAKREIQREENRRKEEERRVQAELKKQENLRKKAERDAEAKARRESYIIQRDNNKKAKDLYKEAFRLYYEGRLAEAKEVFEQILKIDPDQKQARIFIEKRIPSKQRKLEYTDKMKQ